MTPNPILKVLFTLKKHRVKSLLIGGQAAIIYGAAEFSRDSDFVIFSSLQNIEYFKKALQELKAERTYVPPLELQYLDRGHACHFRCNAQGVKGLRIDILSVLRGCAPFDILWKRKKTFMVQKKKMIDVIGLYDLVQSKKTQRDKDWFMIKRLVDNDIKTHARNPSDDAIRWWLQECRDASLLTELAEKYPQTVKDVIPTRPLLVSAISKNIQEVSARLQKEELAERRKDIEYWTPLKKELESLRHNKI